MEVSGNDLIASETDADVYKAIDFLVDKLDRMIRERSRVRRDRRNNATVTGENEGFVSGPYFGLLRPSTLNTHLSTVSPQSSVCR